ncbi:MAG: M23 family metallopeptidase [Campylobacterales bacterium]|nr:M23 family metallopeptidase [Campylobacterales bacterium]
MQKRENDWMVLLPLSLERKPEGLKLVSKTLSQTRTHSINIVPKAYAEQHLSVSNKEYVKASEKTLERIRRESLAKSKSLSTNSLLELKELRMIKPLDSPLRHDFGRRRFFNGVAKSPHSGIDLSGKVGDKIKAPLAGRVIILGDLFYNGNMMLIDHGEGLISAYSHLDKIYKSGGTWVEQGDFIGEVGKSGRVTGPHLHWSVYLKGIAVNPELFLEDATL